MKQPMTRLQETDLKSKPPVSMWFMSFRQTLLCSHNFPIKPNSKTQTFQLPTTQKLHLSQQISKPIKPFDSESENLSMAASVSASVLKRGLLGTSFNGSWGSSINGDDYNTLLAKSVPDQIQFARKPVRAQPMMKNVNEGKGVFAPLVVVTRNIVGKKRFNQLRGKAIALHSQVITEFCKSIGADAKQRQGLIRLAKKNGEKLGFLA